MQAKDLICYIVAPFRTVVEAGIIGGLGTSLVYGLSLLLTKPSWWLCLIGNILIVLIFALAGGMVVFGIAYLFWLRSKDNYDHCKEFWDKD